MASENLLPNSYTSTEQALKVAGQIRRSSLVLKNDQNAWKVLVINNRAEIFEDVKLLLSTNEENFVNINDGYGNISRKVAQLNSESLETFIKVLSKYDVSGTSTITKTYNDLTLRLKKLIRKEDVKQDDSSNIPNKSGIFNIKPMTLNFYFKTFTPIELKVEQKFEDKTCIYFALHLVISNARDFEVIKPSIRKSGKEYEQLFEELKNNKKIKFVFELQERYLKKSKDKFYEVESIDNVLFMKNPLNKTFLTQLDNYIPTQFNVI